MTHDRLAAGRTLAPTAPPARKEGVSSRTNARWSLRRRLAVAVGLAGLLCGTLWEFWNFWATPKWVYHIPYVDFLRVFEMPLLGYAGYIPFAWSIYQLLNIRPLKGYLGPGPR